MSLDGLRAWIGEVERKLGMRTRVFLVLVAIAVGGAGAAIYLAAEADEGQVGAADLRAMESRLESEIEALQQLQTKVEALEAERQTASGARKEEEKAKP
jgi:hypothetical protein